MIVALQPCFKIAFNRATVWFNCYITQYVANLLCEKCFWCKTQRILIEQIIFLQEISMYRVQSESKMSLRLTIQRNLNSVSFIIWFQHLVIKSITTKHLYFKCLICINTYLLHSHYNFNSLSTYFHSDHISVPKY